MPGLKEDLKFVLMRNEIMKNNIKSTIRKFHLAFRLLLTYPWLIKFFWYESRIVSRLEKDYHAYVTSISTADMAISIRLAALLAFICEEIQPKVIYDLGSGFSSFVLHLYAKSCLTPPTVYSVDGDAAWLEASQNFLRERQLETEETQFYTFDNFCRADIKKGDLVLLDIFHTEDGSRAAVLEKLNQWIKNSTLIVVDDMSKPKYRQTVYTWAKKMNITCVDLLPFTQDVYGRFSSLLFKSGK